jgi:steroid delta-isomerase-like uncharacterized protein
MSDNKETVKRYYLEVFNEGRSEVLDEIAVTDHVEHDPFPGQSQGIEGLRQRVGAIRGAFNPQFTLEDVLESEGDKVVVRWTNRGIHQAEFFGVPPTGKEVVATGIDIHQMRDGKMAEHWDEVDLFGVMMQLGAIPAPGGS